MKAREVLVRLTERQMDGLASAVVHFNECPIALRDPTIRDERAAAQSAITRILAAWDGPPVGTEPAEPTET